MDLKEIKNNLQISENIFDIYIIVEDILSRNISDLDSAEKKEYSEDAEWTKFIKKIFHKENFNLNFNQFIKQELINNIPMDNKYKTLSFLKCILMEIDNISKNNYYTTQNIISESDGSTLVELKELNSPKTHHLGKVIYVSNSFLENKIPENLRFRLDKYIGSTIERYQSNLLVVENIKSDIKTNMYQVTDDYLVDRFSNKDTKYKIALVPLSGDDNLLNQKFNKLSNKELFTIEGINNENEYIDKVENILNELVKFKIDIVVFPEMIITDKILEKIRETIKSNRGAFGLVICGTVWKGGQNTCVIFGGNGRLIGRQKKLNPYEYINQNNVHVFEDINISGEEKIVNIYNLKNLGRFCTPICVDFINDKYFNNVINYGVNISFNPTYTASLTAFETNAYRLGSKNFGSVFLSNCCSAIHKKEEKRLSMVYVPMRENAVKEIRCTDKKCKSGLCPKVFIVDFSSLDNLINAHIVNF